MRYTTTIESPLGPLTLVSDGAALTALEFDDRAAGAKGEGPRVRDDDAPPFPQARRELGEYFAGSRTVFDVPIAPSGTAFQRRVWEALLRIPCGSTASYGEIARAVGSPDAVRAVGAANGRNPIAIVVPCHRVIGKDGSLTGFGGGIETKRALLELEGALRVSPPGQLRLSGLQSGQSQPKVPAVRSA